MEEGGIGPGQREDHGLVVGGGDAGKFGGLAAGQRRHSRRSCRNSRRPGSGSPGLTARSSEYFTSAAVIGAAIVEFDAVAQLEGIGEAVIGNRVAFGEVGLELGRAGLVVHEPVEDRLDHRPVLPVIADLRIERGEIVVEGDDCRTALLGCCCEAAGMAVANGEAAAAAKSVSVS